MKATLKTIALLAISSGLASAASTILACYDTTSFRTDAGALLGSSFTARIGLSSQVGAFATTADFAAINATWTAVSAQSYAFSSSAANNPGYFSGTYTYSTQPGVNIMLWVSDGANQNFVAVLPQVFANDANAPFNSNTFDITAANAPTLTFKLGSYQAGTDGFGGAGGNLVLNNVPEPSAALLGALGALGLLRRRRI